MTQKTRTEETLAAFAARNAIGRLVGYLAARFGTLTDAEDALAEALTAALSQWPAQGVPDNPSAWLLTVARRRLADAARRGAAAEKGADHIVLLAEEAQEAAMADREFPDERLRLMFLCTHPAIDRAIQAPLMLQTVLGFQAAEIAGAFLIAPNTMGQRLARAKNKIRESALSFDLPSAADRPARVAALLDAIYICYTRGWIAAPQSASAAHRSEALWLADIVAAVMPGEAEAMGLCALLLHLEARKAAGRVGDTYVPLGEQDITLWDRAMIDKAEAVLKAASGLVRPGRFQIEAAIQSVHADRARTGKTDWDAIVALYDALRAIAPSTGAEVARAGALTLAERPDHAQAALDALPDEQVKAYQPYWAVRGALSAKRGDHADAAQALSIAAGLSLDPAERRYLLTKRAALAN